MEEGGGMIMTCKVALVVDVFLVDSIQDSAWGAKPSQACLSASRIFVLVYKSLPTFVFYASVCCGCYMIYFPAARSHSLHVKVMMVGNDSSATL